MATFRRQPPRIRSAGQVSNRPVDTGMLARDQSIHHGARGNPAPPLSLFPATSILPSRFQCTTCAIPMNPWWFLTRPSRKVTRVGKTVRFIVWKHMACTEYTYLVDDDVTTSFQAFELSASSNMVE